MYKKDNESNIIWHYCSYKSFKKIIKSHLFKLSSIKNSNDPSELELYKEYDKDLKKLLYSIKTIDCNIADFDLKEQFYDTFYKSLFICLTENDDFLPMWHMYADSCRGVALGFKKTWIDKVFNITCEDKIELYPHFGQVRYNKKERNELVSELRTIKGDYCLGKIKARLALFKDEHYSYEKEWRATVKIDIASQEQYRENTQEFNMQYTPLIVAGKDYDQVYLSIAEEGDNCPLVEVKLGALSKHSEECVKEYLKKNGFTKSTVSKSSIPYRDK